MPTVQRKYLKIGKNTVTRECACIFTKQTQAYREHTYTNANKSYIQREKILKEY